MSLEDLGNLGEFLSSIGVLVTLVYLANQVRQTNTLANENRDATKAQIVQVDRKNKRPNQF